jgi:hypothetical protein
MTEQRHDRCTRCRKYHARYHIAKGDGYVAVCCECLTDTEKSYQEKSWRNLKAWEEWRDTGNGGANATQ